MQKAFKFAAEAQEEGGTGGGRAKRPQEKGIRSPGPANPESLCLCVLPVLNTT